MGGLPMWVQALAVAAGAVAVAGLGGGSGWHRSRRESGLRPRAAPSVRAAPSHGACDVQPSLA